MARVPSVYSNDRHRMPTEELYRSRVANGGIAPAFNNIYDVSINFENSQSLASYLSQSTLYDKQASPGQFLSLFCSEALLPGSQIQTSQVDGLRQGVSQNYATFRRYPDINLTWYSQRDYYTNDIFNAWLEFISPTHLSRGGHGFNTTDRINDIPSFRRLQYPRTYKCPIEITAFSKEVHDKGKRLDQSDNFDVAFNRSNSITYYLQNAFPVNIIASPLAYGKSELIKTTVSFKYEYFYIDRTASNGNGFLSSDKFKTRDPIHVPPPVPSIGTGKEYDDYFIEAEEHEWGPKGQPSASEQLKIYNETLGS